jgi:hypothetical protein
MKLFSKRKYIHTPKSLTGYTVWTVAAIFLISVFFAIARDSHSVSDTFYGIFPYFVSTFLLVEWFASKNSD